MIWLAENYEAIVLLILSQCGMVATFVAGRLHAPEMNEHRIKLLEAALHQAHARIQELEEREEIA